MLPVEYSHAYNLDLTSYEFYARLLDIHGVCDDTSGMRNSRLSDETTQKTKHKKFNDIDCMNKIPFREEIK